MTGKVVFVGKVADRNSGFVPVVVRVANSQERLAQRLPSKSASKRKRGNENDRRRIGWETLVSPSRTWRSSWSWQPWAGPPGHRPTRAGGARGTRRQWAGGGIRLRRRSRRARLVQFGGAGSCRLRNHSLLPLDQHRDVCERVDGWTHRMTRNQMLWSAHHQAARGHARGGTWFRFPSKELRWGWKIHPQLPSGCKMAPAMPHVVLEAAVARASMLRPIPRGAVVRDHCPRRRTQNSDTTQDQQVTHTASSRDSQASSPFLFDQATGLPCKFNSNLECRGCGVPGKVWLVVRHRSARWVRLYFPRRPLSPQRLGPA